MDLKELILAEDIDRLDELTDGGEHVDDPIDGLSPVEFAISHERWKAAVKLVDNGANLWDKQCRGKPIFHCVVAEGPPELVVVMLDNGANENARDEAGNTPLTVAVRAGRKDVANLLRARGAVE